MEKVKAKKHLGQHFLNDKNIAEKISGILPDEGVDEVIEIGPGMGVLTTFLYPQWKEKLCCVEIDRESVTFLNKADWAKGLKVIEGDFLTLPATEIFTKPGVAVIGNYPYNISTQIAFRVLEHNEEVVFFGGMFQREVAKRFCAESGNKEYGITSVMLQAYYNCKYLFTVNEGAFSPPPKVKSGVMACTSKTEKPSCNYKDLLVVVKTAFNQRRKTLSNALKPLLSSNRNFLLPSEWQGKRAEQLTVENFISLAQLWKEARVISETK